MAEDGKVTITTLMEYTGLSRSTFAKAHIRELLAEYGYNPIGRTNSVTSVKKQIKKSSDKDKIIAELRAKNAALEQKCELLRGRLFLMTQKQTYKEHFNK